MLLGERFDQDAEGLSTVVLRAAAAGDPAAVEQVVNRFRGELYNFARRQGAEDPEGTVHMALTALLTRLDTLRVRTDSSVRAYLYSTVRRSVAKEWRAARRQPYFVPAHADGDDRRLQDGNDQWNDQVASRMLVDDLLDHLNTRDRELVVRRFLLDQGYDQIASDLNMEPNAVRKAGSRALGRLRVVAAAAAVFAAFFALTIGSDDRGPDTGLTATPASEGQIPEATLAMTDSQNRAEATAGIGPQPTDGPAGPAAGGDTETPPTTGHAAPPATDHIAPPTTGHAAPPTTGSAIPTTMVPAPGDPVDQDPPANGEPTPTTALVAPTTTSPAPITTVPEPSTTVPVPPSVPVPTTSPHTPGSCWFSITNNSDRLTQAYSFQTGLGVYTFLDPIRAGETKVVTMPVGFTPRGDFWDVVGLYYVGADGQLESSGFHDRDFQPCGTSLAFTPDP